MCARTCASGSTCAKGWDSGLGAGSPPARPSVPARIGSPFIHLPCIVRSPPAAPPCLPPRPAAEEWRQNPFVQPYAWATDKVGRLAVRGRHNVPKGSARVALCVARLWKGARHLGHHGTSWRSPVQPAAWRLAQPATQHLAHARAHAPTPTHRAPRLRPARRPRRHTTAHARMPSPPPPCRCPPSVQEGWQLMAASPEVLRCYESPWEARYYSGEGTCCTI